MSHPKVLIWGAKSTAHILYDLIFENELGTTEIVHDHTLEASEFLATHTPFKFNNRIEDLIQLKNRVTHFQVGIGGDTLARHETSRALEGLGLRPLKVVDKNAHIDASSYIDDGAIVFPNAHVFKFSHIGKYSLLNIGCTINHDCVIGNGCHIMSGVMMGGYVKVEDFSTIGTSATILPNLTIGTGSIIGAGSVVTKNVEPYSVVVGSPAKHVRTTKLSFDNSHLTVLYKQFTQP